MNIILTEFEKVVVTPLMESGISEFYCKYVNNTLVLVKVDPIGKSLKLFISFHNNLQFTAEKLENKEIQLLDIKIMNNGGTKISAKDTNSGLYINYSCCAS